MEPRKQHPQQQLDSSPQQQQHATVSDTIPVTIVAIVPGQTPHQLTVHSPIHETNPESEEDNSGSDNAPNPLVRIKTIRLLKTAFLNGDRKKLDSILKDMGFLHCVHEKVGVVSRYMQSPRESHACAIKQVLPYLKGTTSFGIKYNRSNDMKLVGYTDSSHNVDIDDGRSTTGHVFHLATAAACHAIWRKELLAEVTRLKRQKRKSKSRPINEGLGAHKVEGGEIVTWCARVTLIDLEIQGVIVREFPNQVGYG
nr:hypothetical protein [Tanacetum cinerariifolium]